MDAPSESFGPVNRYLGAAGTMDAQSRVSDVAVRAGIPRIAPTRAAVRDMPIGHRRLDGVECRVEPECFRWPTQDVRRHSLDCLTWNGRTLPRSSCVIRRGVAPGTQGQRRRGETKHRTTPRRKSTLIMSPESTQRLPTVTPAYPRLAQYLRSRALWLLSTMVSRPDWPPQRSGMTDAAGAASRPPRPS